MAIGSSLPLIQRRSAASPFIEHCPGCDKCWVRFQSSNRVDSNPSFQLKELIWREDQLLHYLVDIVPLLLCDSPLIFKIKHLFWENCWFTVEINREISGILNLLFLLENLPFMPTCHAKILFFHQAHLFLGCSQTHIYLLKFRPCIKS